MTWPEAFHGVGLALALAAIIWALGWAMVKMKDNDE